ncbi:MAG: hypothetical protein F4X57_12220 [Chloroflexi bacterium]|nr:hypothetical protein [Chloroflexota bacterium]
MSPPNAAQYEPTPFSVENQQLSRPSADKIPKGGWALKRFFADLFVDCARESGLLHILQAVRSTPSKPSRGRTLIYSNESLLKAIALRIVEKHESAADLVGCLEGTPQARKTCGLQQGRTPSEATISRFTSLLSKYRAAHWDTITVINRHINTYVATGREIGAFGSSAPAFGEILAIDSTDIKSFSDEGRRPHIDPAVPRPKHPSKCTSRVATCCQTVDWEAADGVKTNPNAPDGKEWY